ncbi:hypothetical protein ACVWXM_005266 [Bradyrhizobium sp. GM7.3]
MNDVRSMNRRRFMTLTGSTLAMLGGGQALAQQPQGRLRIDPTEFRPIPIAITNFVPGSPADGDVGNGVTQVITNNLKRSGLFAPVDQAAFHRAHQQHRRRAAVRELEDPERAGPRHRPHDAAAGRPPQG